MTWNADGWGFIHGEIWDGIENDVEFVVKYPEDFAQDVYGRNVNSWVFDTDEDDEVIRGTLHLVTYDEVLKWVEVAIANLVFGDYEYA